MKLFFISLLFSHLVFAGELLEIDGKTYYVEEITRENGRVSVKTGKDMKLCRPTIIPRGTRGSFSGGKTNSKKHGFEHELESFRKTIESARKAFKPFDKLLSDSPSQKSKPKREFINVNDLPSTEREPASKKQKEQKERPESLLYQ